MAPAMTPSRTGSVLKPALVLMSGRTLGFAATFFIPVILARMLDQVQFGTYKQLFLVFSTILPLAQFGMSQSLYYFLPNEPRRSPAYVANSLVVLALAGVAVCAGLAIAAPAISRWLSNPHLASGLWWIGLYLLLMLVSTGFEIVMVSRSMYAWASASYAVSDLLRAAAFILPVLATGQLLSLLAGAVAAGAVRAGATLWYFLSQFGRAFRPDAALLRTQLGYALPFGFAVLVEILQANLPQYVVSHAYDPATFAVFAVGCLQIPLVDFAASPTSDVMMVRMQESLSAGDRAAVLGIWNDTTVKLSMLFFPLTALMMVDAHEIIVLLFTTRYAASAPIFLVWCGMVLLTAFQVDGVLRVFAQTRALLGFNMLRLVLMAALLGWSLATFHLAGAALVCVIANAAFKTAALIRMRRLLDVPARRVLPWGRLGSIAAATALAALAALALRRMVTATPLQTMAATSVLLPAVYTTLIWRFGLLERRPCAE